MKSKLMKCVGVAFAINAVTSSVNATGREESISYTSWIFSGITAILDSLLSYIT